MEQVSSHARVTDQSQNADQVNRDGPMAAEGSVAPPQGPGSGPRPATRVRVPRKPSAGPGASNRRRPSCGLAL